MFTAYPLCSLNLICCVLSDSPTYWIEQLSQKAQWMMFFDWQLTTGLLISTVNFVANGHIAQLSLMSGFVLVLVAQSAFGLGRLSGLFIGCGGQGRW